MKDFAGKVAAITGAGSGMGRELALELARRGCHLALSDISDKGLSETVGMVRGTGIKVTSEVLDVADRDAVHAWADRVAGDHGKVNLVFNNAGVGLGSSVENVSYENFEWLMGINFWGVVHGTKAFLPHLQRSGDGHVINTSSLFGIIGAPLNSTYNASKFAVRGFTESLREELDLFPCGVSATSVHPGGIQTNIARAARHDGTLEKLGVNQAAATREFEKAFITSAHDAALQILRAVEKNRRRVLVGPDAKLIDLIQRIFPSAYQHLVIWFFRRNMANAKKAAQLGSQSL